VNTNCSGTDCTHAIATNQNQHQNASQLLELLVVGLLLILQWLRGKLGSQLLAG
jgi:hypothetical protein